MATLKYVIGVPKEEGESAAIDGADKYHLYKNASDVPPSTPNVDDRISTQSTLFDFEHYGAIGTSGKIIEKETKIFYTYNAEGTGNEVLGRPLRRITEDGIRYCVGVSAWLSLSYGGGVNTPVFLSGEYSGLTNEYFTIHGGDGFSKESDGWYLKMSIKQGSAEDFSVIKIRMLGLDDNIKDVGFGKGQTTVFVHYVEYNDNHRHTEYIPLDALGDGWSVSGTSGMCVGKFDLSDDDYDYPKMAFYDKNLKFVGGAKSDWLAVYTMGDTAVTDYYYKPTDSTRYFTAEGVMDIAAKIATANNATGDRYPKFVVFSSRWSGTADKDKVSVPISYFPLFAMRDKFEAGTHYLFATADSASALFKESPASEVKVYTVSNTAS